MLLVTGLSRSDLTAMANALRQFMGALETNRCAVMLLSPERTAEVADCDKACILLLVFSELVVSSICAMPRISKKIREMSASITASCVRVLAHLCLKRIAFKVPLIPALRPCQVLDLQTYS